MIPENKKDGLALVTCASCRGTGFSGVKRCPTCHGAAVGYSARGRWLYWNYPINRYHLRLLRVRRLFNKIRRATLLISAAVCFGWVIFYAYQRGVIGGLMDGNWTTVTAFGRKEIWLFWLGFLIILYFWSRLAREKKVRGEVERFDYRETLPPPLSIADNVAGYRLPRRQKKNINQTFNDLAMEAISRAYQIADRGGFQILEPEHLFYALLSLNSIGNIFIRLGVSEKIIQERVAPIIRAKAPGKASAAQMPLPSTGFWQTVFNAYEIAYQAHAEYVGATELLVSATAASEEILDVLTDFGIDAQKLNNVVEWARVKERLYNRYQKRAVAATRRNKYGMDRAMTALATPLLNSVSADLTRLAQLGQIDFCVARQREMLDIFQAVEGGEKNILLVGDYGVGRRTVVEGIAEKMIVEDVPEVMRDKRLVRLSVSSLLAGATPAGAIERLIQVLHETAAARNVVLFIHNLHELIGVSMGAESGSLDVAGTLVERLNAGNFITIATTTPREYSRHIANSNLSGIFTKVDIAEMSIDQAIQAVESKIGFLEYKNKVFFSYSAIEQAVKLSSQYLHEAYLPGSALDVVNESAAYTKNQRGVNSLVTAEEVAVVVANKTGIPVATVSADESARLLNLEQEMHHRVIGQDEAVDLVANALRRARVGVRAENRPIANFMFLGPTGVGKTELSKTIAEVYFGGEDKMIRLDMSEYQDKTGIHRLLGAPDAPGTGLLTEAVRRQPFSLLLLDEIEKADKDVLNLFLQVMDDGRLTDSAGRVVDFTNLILIATSNARTDYVSQQLQAGLSVEAIKERLLRGELADYFRPEFLNRFDGIVLFRALDFEAMRQIAALMMARVAREMEEKGIELTVTPAGLEFLAKIGFDPEFGARPLRRVIQERVENKLAELLLSGQLKRRDKIEVGAEGELKIIEKL